MNKSDLVAALSQEADLPQRKSEDIVNLVFETMGKALLGGDRIEIRGFGSFTEGVRGVYGEKSQNGRQDISQGKEASFL